MNGVRVIGVGPTLTAAVPGDALVRVYDDLTLWHQDGNLHKLTVHNGAVVEAVVSRGTREYRAGMSVFGEEGD